MNADRANLMADVSRAHLSAQDELRGKGIRKLPPGIYAEQAKFFPMLTPVALTARVTIGSHVVVE